MKKKKSSRPRLASIPRTSPVKTTSKPVHLEGSYREHKGSKLPYGYC